MIIDYDFRGKRVAIVGGGHETARKVRALVGAGAAVRLVGPAFDEDAVEAARELRVPIVRCPEAQVARRALSGTDVLVVIGHDAELGRRLRPLATRRRILFYTTDDPLVSDWIQPAVRRAGPVQVAVSTGGGSPVVAVAVAERLVCQVRPEDLLEVQVQSYARTLAREWIARSADRRKVLRAIHRDALVRTAVRDGDARAARLRARTILRQAAPARLARGASRSL